MFSKPQVSITNCSIGAMSKEHSDIVIALANAAKANAEAILAIASKASVNMKYGIYIGSNEDNK